MTSSNRTKLAAEGAPVVLVVDDEPGMRAALRRLLEAAGLHFELYASGPEMLAEARLDRPGCLLLDVRMPEMDGLQVQTALNERGVELPTIFLTGAADVPIAVSAMRAGAADFIEKPFDNEHLLSCVRRVICRYDALRVVRAEEQKLARLLATLTPREREVLDCVVAGQTSKEIARTLGASPRTIEIHRTHLMQKMGAETLADLVRMRVQDAANTRSP